MSNFIDEYSIVPIDNADDARHCAEFLAVEFVRSNPLSICLGSSIEHIFDEWLWPLMIDSLHDKLSFLVRDRQTNEIIAAIVANDMFHYCEKYPHHPSNFPSADPVTDFFAETRHDFVKNELGQLLKENLIVNIAAGATKSSYTNRGVAVKLRQYLCEYARDYRGFQYAFVQIAHPATRHIYVNKMNGKITRSLDPGKWFLERISQYDQSSPLKNYHDEPIDNILIELNQINAKSEKEI